MMEPRRGLCLQTVSVAVGDDDVCAIVVVRRSTDCALLRARRSSDVTPTVFAAAAADVAAVVRDGENGVCDQ